MAVKGIVVRGKILRAPLRPMRIFSDGYRPLVTCSSLDRTSTAIAILKQNRPSSSRTISACLARDISPRSADRSRSWHLWNTGFSIRLCAGRAILYSGSDVWHVMSAIIWFCLTPDLEKETVKSRCASRVRSAPSRIVQSHAKVKCCLSSPCPIPPVLVPANVPSAPHVALEMSSGLSTLRIVKARHESR